MPGENFSEKLYNIEQYGFEGVEVGGRNLPQRLHEIEAALSTSKVQFATVCAGYPGDLLGADRQTRDAAIEGLKERLKLCASLGGIGVITVPTFGKPKIPDLYPWYPDVREVEKQILIQECKILGKYADNVGAYVLLEPLNRYETHLINRLEQAVEICKAVGREHIKIMADFFHMNIEESDIPSSLETAADYIFHVHLADSNRVLPGHGHTDFKSGFKVLKKVGYKNFMALECRVPGDSPEELSKSVRYLRRFI
ncbi:MAG: sugar phosphate isomerase/epimerase [Candidatus Bathyarchaeota archaeon]|nr:sugar phosphate isomerase/epimerase [Candidatus Bathyarchaeota archaeon]